MAALDITKIVVLPTLRAVIEFAPVTPVPVKYKITFDDGAGHDVSFETTKTMARSPYLRYGKTYTATVEAVIDEEDEYQNIVGEQKTFSTLIQTTNARLLRQAIHDIVADAAIIEDGRKLNIISDKWGMPRLVSEDSNAVVFPILEIELPVTRSVQPRSKARYEEVYEVPMFLMDSCSEPDTGTERIDYLFTMIRKAVNETPSLNLAHLSIIDQSWQWRGDEPEFGEQTVGIEIRLLVSIPQVNIGRLPYQS